jgi:hypothetical protein
MRGRQRPLGEPLKSMDKRFALLTSMGVFSYEGFQPNEKASIDLPR